MHGPSTYSNLLDRCSPAIRPNTATAEDVKMIEAVPWKERLGAASTYEAVMNAAKAVGDGPALIMLPNSEPADGDQAQNTISYRQLAQGINQAANLFHSLGVKPGDVVSFLLPLLPQTFAVLYGAQAVGIANPVNSLLEPHQIAEILQAANTKVVVVLGPLPGTDIWDKFQAIRSQLHNLAAVVQVNPGGKRSSDPLPEGVMDFGDACKDQPANRLVSGRVIDPDEVAGYFHTGGTTGTPKLVRHTHANQLYQAWAVTLMVPCSQQAKLLFGLPLFHVGGSLTQGLANLATGRCLVIVSAAGWRSPNALRNVWRLVDRFKPEVLGAVPTVLAAAQGLSSEGCDTSTIQAVSGGGSAIPVAVAQAMHTRFQCPVLEVYGMTETASVHTISHVDRPIRLGSVGHALPYSRVRVVKLNADGQYLADCGIDEIGVVTMSGPGVFDGYLSDSHNRGAFVEPGWVNSGDLGRLDAQGYLWITGRAKDLIIRGGHNIDPLAIEELFYQHPAVALAALVGQPDAYAGETPVAYVQFKPDHAVDEVALLDYVRTRTPERAAVPVAVITVPAMPLTAVGKVFKPQLRWDAAQRVFSKVLKPWNEAGGEVSVSVGADGTHGTLARITIVKCPDGMTRRELTEHLQEQFAPFTIKHAIESA